MWHICTLSISGLNIHLAKDQVFTVGDAFAPFLAEKTKVDIQCVIRCVDKLPVKPTNVCFTDSVYSVCFDGRNGFVSFFYEFPDAAEPYAISYSDTDGIIHVDYLPFGAHCVSELRNSFFHLGIEGLLIRKDRLCLHAACVETPLGGILFSGPSGIGKSTQAELWCKYRDARQINGDRPILQRTDDGWLAWGSPYAGSSRVYVNDSCSVTAIVMLRQAKECSLRRLTAPEAFRAVWSGLTVHTWDEAFVTLACDLAMDLAAIVPVYEFCCTPDEYAVSYLEQALRKELCL